MRAREEALDPFLRSFYNFFPRVFCFFRIPLLLLRFFSVLSSFFVNEVDPVLLGAAPLPRDGIPGVFISRAEEYPF